ARALRARRAVVTGDTLRRMGLPPGPAYSQVLARIRRARLDGRIRTDEQERAMAEALVRRRVDTARGALLD
ncbi:MAG TPA: hypothetical protein VJV23_05670, partial [Candidatus Polarisedimenticolia bacterium]|nr:hypothetical protein [Candidatus Polarisedimenticolia bacterium]